MTSRSGQPCWGHRRAHINQWHGRVELRMSLRRATRLHVPGWIEQGRRHRVVGDSNVGWAGFEWCRGISSAASSQIRGMMMLMDVRQSGSQTDILRRAILVSVLDRLCFKLCSAIDTVSGQ